MKRSKILFNFIALVGGIVIYKIVTTSFAELGIKKWEGKYEELGYCRNENNTGPIVRVLALRVMDEDPKWMEEFGNSQPHSKYGRTLVFYFKSTVSGKIELSPKEPFFDEIFQPYLVAKYEKNTMSKCRFEHLSP